MEGIREIASGLKEFERISAHSHITGLGLDGLKAKKEGDGLVGQVEAREAAGLVVRLVKSGKFAGRGVLIAGPPGTGKTAIAVGIAKELGKDVPFVPITASEIYSTEVKKTEFLTQALRKAIGVRIREYRKVYEGVVEDIKINYMPHPYNPYYKIPQEAVVTIATKDEKKTLSVDQNYAMQLVQLGVEKNDVIQIDVDGKRIVKVGKSEKAKKSDYIATEEYVPIPSGSVFKEKEFVYTVTLHELDVINARRGTDLFSIFFGATSREIDNELRSKIDETVKEWVSEGRAEIIPGVLFIDECSMLDIDAFAFLNRAMEQDLAPIIIFATNRGFTKIKGTDITSPHGMPLDLLDRLLIINTKPYERNEIRRIIEIRASKEKVNISKEALELLTDIGYKTSLRHSMQLIAPAYEVAKENGREKIEKEDVEFVSKLFVDVKRSSEYLRSYEDKMLK